MSTLPNIVIIIVDGLRPKDLSLYGHHHETDKNIKKIAAESIIFKKNFSASNATDVSLTAIFSGQYPLTNGFLHQAPNMEKEEIEKLRKNKFWFPLSLQKIGYNTISLTPQYLWFKKGFDYYTDKKIESFGKYLNTPPIKRALLRLPNWAYKIGKNIIKTRTSPYFISSKDVVDLAISKIKETKEPYFLFMHFADTHCPYAGVKPKRNKGEKTIKKILFEIEENQQKEYIKKRFYDSSTNNLEQIKQKLEDSIISVDEQIGRLHFFFKKRQLWDNTIFLILSDHGDNFGEHEIYFCRGGLYDSSIHVPLIMHLPGIKPKEISEITSSIDIFPTILDFLKEKKIKVDGKSLLPLIKNGEKIRKEIIAVDGFFKNRVAIRTKTKKTITSTGDRCYLCGGRHGQGKEEYDLKKDCEELRNLSSEKITCEAP